MHEGSGTPEKLEDPLVEAPLHSQDASLSRVSAFLLLLKINWGIGMMAMPYYILKAGLTLGMSAKVASFLFLFAAPSLSSRWYLL